MEIRDWYGWDIFWEYDDRNTLRARIVKKGHGNKKPQRNYAYDLMSREEKMRNKERFKELIDKIKDVDAIDYDHEEVLEAARRLGKFGRVMIEGKYLEEQENLRIARKELEK